MKNTTLLVSFFLLTGTLFCQTVHDIEAGGGPGGVTPYYAPQFITIQVGDIVRWTNSGGTHNVDGRQSVFPANPEGFFSGNPTSTWTVWEYTFNVPGFYNFECGAFDHNETQFGTIDVIDTSVGIYDSEELGIEIGPNPVSDNLWIRTEREIRVLKVFGMKGDELFSIAISQNAFEQSLDLSGLRSGQYVLEIITEAGPSRQLFQKD